MAPKGTGPSSSPTRKSDSDSKKPGAKGSPKSKSRGKAGKSASPTRGKESEGKKDRKKKEQGPDVPRPDENILDLTKNEILWSDPDKGGQSYIQEILDNLGDSSDTMPPVDQDPNQRHVSGFTPLALAAAAGKQMLVSLLLEYQADPSLPSLNRAQLPLHLAAMRGHHLICELLAGPTRSKGLLDAPDSMGWNALHYSASECNIKAMRSLIRCKARLDEPNRIHGNDTAMHLAVRQGFYAGLEALIEHDCNPSVTDSSGRTALHFAAQRADLESVSLLLRSRCDPNLTGPGGAPLLDLVPQGHEHTDKVVKLLSAYARPPPVPRRIDTRFDLGDEDLYC
eukprot:gnl/TRDRNA2_/TRDRNA2_43322_c0_seq1.p1 gnl/TRDRNA2_/TRDRNA2_43322_c0~~gnl/TRDRNA2_/TRDRNA2_43322_c0_seq1.p1  ORF type:complete len:352 (-),score=47.18 gnl/TRDRNA2_/TRDRNA2_43322_c0_seq1:129-1145(-)